MDGAKYNTDTLAAFGLKLLVSFWCWEIDTVLSFKWQQREKFIKIGFLEKTTKLEQKMKKSLSNTAYVALATIALNGCDNDSYQTVREEPAQVPVVAEMSADTGIVAKVGQRSRFSEVLEFPFGRSNGEVRLHTAVSYREVDAQGRTRHVQFNPVFHLSDEDCRFQSVSAEAYGFEMQPESYWMGILPKNIATQGPLNFEVYYKDELQGVLSFGSADQSVLEQTCLQVKAGNVERAQ